MIYGTIGGKIGYSSSKNSTTTAKKLFTPIQLSVPNASDINNHKEKSTPNSPRKNEKQSPIKKDVNLTFTQRITNKNFTQSQKVTFFLPEKKKSSSSNNSRTSSPDIRNRTIENYNQKKDISDNKIYFLRSKSKNITTNNINNIVQKSLLLFDENFDMLVNSIKKNKEIEKKNNIIPEKNNILNKEKELRKTKTKKSSSTLNNPKLIFNSSFTSLEDEAKSMTNTIEIANFYEYTKNCMRIIVQLKENKNKASMPNKVKILNPDNHTKLAVFDLDETLIHGVVNISNYNKLENIISITLPSKKIAKIGVNIRPHWKEAIERISKLYTIVIYTASHKSYADAVLNFLDPENKYFYNRLYRSNCIDCKIDGKDLYVKDMNIFEGFDLKDILIVDNSVMAFAYNLDNGIPILPYYDAEKDYELLFVAYYFESLYNCDDLTVINKQYMKLDYYLKQAIEEIKRENEEDEEEKEKEESVELKKKDSINNNYIIRRSKEKEKGIAAQNMILLRKQKEKRKGRKRKSQFIEEFQFDLKELRNKFSRDDEIV